MSRDGVAEALAQYLDSESLAFDNYLAQCGERRDAAQPLFETARLLKRVLVPMQPSPRFMDMLKSRLMAMSSSELVHHTQRPVRRLVVGAFALGSVASAAAVYLVFFRGKPARAA